MNIKSIVIAASTIFFAANANASIFNTLNGVNYEWLDLTTTAGQSRTQVEVLLDTATPGDTLYGFEYASWELLEDLFLSYNTWDGIGGWHSSPSTITGVDALFNDFGVLNIDTRSGFLATVDGAEVRYNSLALSDGLYGLAGECGINKSCRGTINRLEFLGETTASFMLGVAGYDSLISNPATRDNSFTDSSTGSFLVRVAVVPIPPSAFLFVSGLICLVRFTKVKNS